ncbi:MAG: hypothetical protein F6K30_01045 [Cyanothece sp. SIO2G6]|nr:hypothetical protein [Cyanothece sp. SIO2G6]
MRHFIKGNKLRVADDCSSVVSDELTAAQTRSPPQWVNGRSLSKIRNHKATDNFLVHHEFSIVRCI